MHWLSLANEATCGRRGLPKRSTLPAGPSDPQQRATEIGRELLHAAREHRTGPFSARFWSDQLMNWAMKDPAFRVQLFRFIDVFPMLRTPEQVHEYLLDYLSQPGVTLPPGDGTRTEGRRTGQRARGQDHCRADYRDCAQLHRRRGRRLRPAYVAETLERRRGLQRRFAGRNVPEP